MILERDESGKIKEFMNFDNTVNNFDQFADFSIYAAEDMIGNIFYDGFEFDAVLAVSKALEEVLEVDYPDDLTTEYVRTPRWISVVRASERALRVMCENDLKMKRTD